MKFILFVTVMCVSLIYLGCAGPGYSLEHPPASSETLKVRENEHRESMRKGTYPDGPASPPPTSPSRRAEPSLPPFSNPPVMSGTFGSYHALVIGINTYVHWRRLTTAVNDATAVAQILENKYGFKVKMLKDAKRTDIIQALERLRDTLTERDNLLIYYAGHGHLDDEEDRGYWIPADGHERSHEHWIPTTTITDTLKALQAKHVMVVADSCYAGTLTRGSNPLSPRRDRDEAYFTRVAQLRARVVIVSGGLEPVRDRGGRGHSVFAKAFLDALEESPRVIDAQALFIKIRDPVVRQSDQTPQYSDVRSAGHYGGDFLFVHK